MSSFVTSKTRYSEVKTLIVRYETEDSTEVRLNSRNLCATAIERDHTSNRSPLICFIFLFIFTCSSLSLHAGNAIMLHNAPKKCN